MRRRALLLSVGLWSGCGAPDAPPVSSPVHAPTGGAGGREHAHHAHTDHDFSDAASWSKVFDDPARDAWQKPDEVVALLEITPGATVVDLGAGTGYFESHLSGAVGGAGTVIALDPEPNMVDFMTWRAKKDGLRNVTPRVCPLDGTGLADASVDRVLVVDTWHHLGDRAAYAKHLAAVVKPGGLVAVVDFTLDAAKGPPPSHRVPPEKVIEALVAAGFTASAVAETLPDQYVVVGRKSTP